MQSRCLLRSLQVLLSFHTAEVLLSASFSHGDIEREGILASQAMRSFRRNRMEAAVIGETWNEVVSLRDLILSDCGLTSESVRSCLLSIYGDIKSKELFKQ